LQAHLYVDLSLKIAVPILGMMVPGFDAPN